MSDARVSGPIGEAATSQLSLAPRPPASSGTLIQGTHGLPDLRDAVLTNENRQRDKAMDVYSSICLLSPWMEEAHGRCGAVSRTGIMLPHRKPCIT